MQLGGGCGRLLAQSGEQPADFVAGQRDQLVFVRAAGVVLGGGQDGQERVGEQGQDGPPVLVFRTKPSPGFLQAQKGSY